MPSEHITGDRRIELLWQVMRGETTLAEACHRHGLAQVEVESWLRDVLAVDAPPRNGHDRLDDLRTIIDTIPTLAWCADENGAAEFFNQRWLDYVGLSAEEASGWGWTVALHPDDVARVSEHWSAIVVSAKPGELEARLRRHDGEYRSFLFRAAPLLDRQGKPVKWYGTNTDIERRARAEEVLRASERSFRLIVESMPGFVCTMSAYGEIEFVNQQILDYAGMSRDELRDWRSLVHEDDLGYAGERWSWSVATGRPYEIEHRIRRADGAYRWFNVRGRALCDEEGRILRWHVVLADIDERKTAEESARRSQAELAHVVRLSTMGEMTASIAHEVNQPLTAVVNNASACLNLLPGDAPAYDEIRDALQEIVDDANRASTVIDRVRQLVLRAPSERRPLDLAGVVADVLALAHHESIARRVTIRAELEDLPLVSGDRVQLQQVLLNLVVNGMDAMGELESRSRVLTISGRSATRDGAAEAVVRVRDAGVGLPAQDGERLFEAFYTTKPHGMGMGLAISRSIVTAHRGRLWAEPNDGPGATFVIALPAASEGV